MRHFSSLVLLSLLTGCSLSDGGSSETPSPTSAAATAADAPQTLAPSPAGPIATTSVPAVPPSAPTTPPTTTVPPPTTDSAWEPIANLQSRANLTYLGRRESARVYSVDGTCMLTVGWAKYRWDPVGAGPGWAPFGITDTVVERTDAPDATCAGPKGVVVVASTYTGRDGFDGPPVFIARHGTSDTVAVSAISVAHGPEYGSATIFDGVTGQKLRSLALCVPSQGTCNFDVFPIALAWSGNDLAVLSEMKFPYQEPLARVRSLYADLFHATTDNVAATSIEPF